MEKEEKVRELQKQGVGYKKIALLLDLPENSVKSYCRRHPVDTNEKVCPQCGATIKNTPHKREKKFCSDKCRMLWWNAHPEMVNRKAVYHLVCKHCQKPFDCYGNAKKQYCSRACFAEARKKGGEQNG